MPDIKCLYVVCHVDPWEPEFNWSTDWYYGYSEDFHKLEIKHNDDGTFIYAMTLPLDKETIYSAQLKMLPMIREDLTARIEGLSKLKEKSYQEEAEAGTCSKFLNALEEELKKTQDSDDEQGNDE